MKGSVLVIGSLLWENENNAISKIQGQRREKWRECLDLSNRIPVSVPICYGRKSSTRRCTYTMVFANSVKNLGTAFIVPYKDKTPDYKTLRQQAIELAEAEGISSVKIKKYSNRLSASWGAIGIKIRNKPELNQIKKNWTDEFKHFNNLDYCIGNERPSISSDGMLNFEIDLPETIDFVFATPVKPELSQYPSIERVAKAVIESKPKYDTYVKENYDNGIRIHDDTKLIEFLLET